MKTAFVLIIITLTISCTASKTVGGPITYSKNVKPIIDANCASSCHNAVKPAGGIDLTTYEKVKQQSVEGKLILAIQQGEGAKAMPKRAEKLADATIQVIVDWVNTGAAE